MPRFAALLILSVLAPAMPGAQAPSGHRDSLVSVERALVRYADAHTAEAVALLQRVVNINSGTLNFAGVRETGAVFRAELDALGFTTRWEDGTAYHRAGHLVAERMGTPGAPKILLIGHLDTVFEPESPFRRFERLDSTHARGPGSIDMKGGDVIVIEALKALKAVRPAGPPDRSTLPVVFHGDEDHAGEPVALARKTLIEAARGAIAAIGFEDGDGDPPTARSEEHTSEL